MVPDPPKYRPLERFWPYADLSEQPSEEELAALDPDLHEALFGARPRPFSITLVFPDLDIADFPRALALARASAEFRETGKGEAHRYRARFWSSDAARLRELFDDFFDTRARLPRRFRQPAGEIHVVLGFELLEIGFEPLQILFDGAGHGRFTAESKTTPAATTARARTGPVDRR